MKDHIFELRGKMETWLITACYTHNLSSCEIKIWRKFRPEGDSNPWPLQYRCSALSTELSSLWELVTWVRNIPVDDDEYKWIYERSNIWTAEKDMETWLIIAVIHNLSSCEIKAWKKFRPEHDSNSWPLRIVNIWSSIYSLAFVIIYGYIANSKRDFQMAW